MKRVVVIGGGFAGLAAGVALAERGIGVTVLEARPHLGGRAYSFQDAATGTTIDNGQHAMMGCYTETLAFLERIGAAAKVARQRNLRVDMVDASGGAGSIACPPLPGPLHMLAGVLRYRLLRPADRWGALAGGARLLVLHRRRDPRLATWTVADLLRHLGQSADACARFWHPVAIATLNETPDRAAAAPFAEVLARAFFGSRADAQFVLPRVGLSDLYTVDARRFLESRGGRVDCRATVERFRFADDRLSGVDLRDGRTIAADGCISAVPPRALEPLVPPSARVGALAALDGFGASPIVSAHLWYDRPVLGSPFVGLIGTTTQWLFDRTRLEPAPAAEGPQCVSAVISGDREAAGWDTAEVTRVVDGDVRRTLPGRRDAALLQAVVVKEKHATIAPTLAAERRRPGTDTPIDGLYLAGDWTATGLPPTIESAVLSGHRAAARVAARLG